ncbi:hypothetical protein T492DRAFT_1096465 [Pavlovales sp. CCMP2436]|nr:hypothetical protein T492DRAFT_1096465 [Pavlovales sp. CCMP2436]
MQFAKKLSLSLKIAFLLPATPCNRCSLPTYTSAFLFPAIFCNYPPSSVTAALCLCEHDVVLQIRLELILVLRRRLLRATPKRETGRSGG